MLRIILADYRYSWKVLTVGTVIIFFAAINFLGAAYQGEERTAIFVPQFGMLLLAFMVVIPLSEKRSRYQSLLPLSMRKIATAKMLSLVLVSLLWSAIVVVTGLFVAEGRMLSLAIGQSLTLIGFSLLPGWLTEVKLIYPKKIRALLSLLVSMPLALLFFVFLALPMESLNPFAGIFGGAWPWFSTFANSFLSSGWGPLLYLLVLVGISLHSIHLFTLRKSYMEAELGLS